MSHPQLLHHVRELMKWKEREERRNNRKRGAVEGYDYNECWREMRDRVRQDKLTEWELYDSKYANTLFTQHLFRCRMQMYVESGVQPQPNGSQVDFLWFTARNVYDAPPWGVLYVW